MYKGSASFTKGAARKLKESIVGIQKASALHQLFCTSMQKKQECMQNEHADSYVFHIKQQ